MFKDIIRSTQLTTDAANDFFQNISGDRFQEDVSFLSTLRALVKPRMNDEESIYLTFTSSRYSADDLSSMSVKRAVKFIWDVGDVSDGTIIIHSFNSSQDNNYAWMELMKSTFTKVYPDWYRLEKVTDFFIKTFYTLCFVNPDKKSVIVFVDNMNIRKMHYLQCSIFAFLPWYFDPKLGVSKVEMALIESLRGSDVIAYTECIKKIAEQYDFRTDKIRRLLTGFETSFERLECDRVRSEIEHCVDVINSLNNDIGSWLQEKNDREIKLLGLEAKIASGGEESEIMDYFLCNDNLVLENVSGTQVTFVAKGYLEYFDDDLAERVINSATSYIYQPNGRGCNNIIKAEDMNMLMTAIFLEQKLRIRVCAVYKLNINNNVTSISNYDYGVDCDDCTPNPHIDKFTCLGNYSRAINDLLKRHDYIGAIEQCCASNKSLNFGDSTVLCEFMRRIYGIADRQAYINMRCIELPSGDVVTPTEAIKWLKQEVKSE